MATTKTIQQQLAEEIQLVYINSIVKKIDKDNFLDIHIPEINKKKGTHLFFNTTKEAIKIGFYCRDEDFVNIAASHSQKIEKYSQGLRILDNPFFIDVVSAISAALSFISDIIGESNPSLNLIDSETIKISSENESFIRSLESFDSETMVMVQMFSQYGIKELGNGAGTWNGNYYTFDYTTDWNEGYLENSEAISVENLIDLLKSKSLEEIDQDDFDDLYLGTIRNGNTSYENFEWENGVSKKDIKIAPSEEELCGEGDKLESEYFWSSPERIEFVITEEGKEDLNYVLSSTISNLNVEEEQNDLADISTVLENVKLKSKKSQFEIIAYKNNLEEWEEFYTVTIKKTTVQLKVTRRYYDSYWKATVSRDELVELVEIYEEEQDLDSTFQLNWSFHQEGDGFNEVEVEVLNYDSDALPLDCWVNNDKNSGVLDAYAIFSDYPSILDDEETLVKGNLSSIVVNFDSEVIFRIDSESSAISEDDNTDENESSYFDCELNIESLISNAIIKIENNKTLPGLLYVNTTLEEIGFNTNNLVPFFFSAFVQFSETDTTGFLHANIHGLYSNCNDENSFDLVVAWDDVIDISLMESNDNSSSIKITSEDSVITITDLYSNNLALLTTIYNYIWKDVVNKFLNDDEIDWGVVENEMAISIIPFNEHDSYINWLNGIYNYEIIEASVEELVKDLNRRNLSKNTVEIIAYNSTLTQFDEDYTLNIEGHEVWLTISRSYYDSFWKTEIPKDEIIGLLDCIKKNGFQEGLDTLFGWEFYAPGKEENSFEISLKEYNPELLPENCFVDGEVDPYTIYEEYESNFEDMDITVRGKTERLDIIVNEEYFGSIWSGAYPSK